MTLLVTVIAAVICTAIWYRKTSEDTMKISTLCFIYWGASLMWFTDAVFEYSELRAEFFTPSLYGKRCVFRNFGSCIGACCMGCQIAYYRPETHI